MYVLATNMWFSSLMRQFFFWIDKIVFNFISSIYDVLIAIARTSVFTQADFAEMTDRIYKLLAVFMVFKVTLSLITYVVNPDNFTEKSKGVYKLSTNIIISLAMLILTPYIFSYAYQVQTILLEDNSLGVLIFGGENDNSAESVFNTAGDKIAYTAMAPFFTPNLSLVSSCSNLLGQTDEDGNGKIDFNYACSGWSEGKTNEDGTLYGLIKDNEKNFSEQTLRTYVAGVEYGNLGLMFRQDMALATANDNTEFVMDYKFIFSTATGIIIILLLITFCMDVGVRSIKLAFFQLIAPVPIISYIDPKKGKDGMFKKWAEMCFKTYLSLFVRLVALYFAVFIINKVADRQLVDIVDGSYVNNAIIYVFIIIGALMFAKQLPEILKGLGIKLDGDGKFTLNPLKKLNENTIGGKRLTGAVGGMVAGAARGRVLSGAARGFMANKGFKGGFDKQAEVNRKIGEARMNGAGFLGSRFAGAASAFGMENIGLENEIKKLNKDKHNIDLAERNLDTKIQAKENRKKQIDDETKANQQKAKSLKAVSDSGKALVEFSKNEIKGGKAGVISTKSDYLHNIHAYLEKHQNETAESDITYYKKNAANKLEMFTIKAGEQITTQHATDAQGAIGLYENKLGAIEHLQVRIEGQKGRKAIETVDANGVADYERDEDGNIRFVEMDGSEKEKYMNSHSDFEAEYSEYIETVKVNNHKIKETAAEIKEQSDKTSAEAKMITGSEEMKKAEAEKEKLDREISELRENSKIIYKGAETTIAEAKRDINKREKDVKDKQDVLKTNVDAYKNRRIGGGS